MSAAAIENTAPAPPPDGYENDGFVGRRSTATIDNPHAERYAYMPGVYYAQANPRTTGFAFFPQGNLITFQTFSSGGHFNPDFYENAKAAPGIVREISAQMASLNAATEYMTVESVESGFVLLPSLTGRTDARAIFDALHPPFSAIDAECPFGLSVCPTCRSLWLESEASKRYFNQVAGPSIDRDLALSVKQVLYDSTSKYASYCVDTWNELSEMYERTRGKDNPFVLGKQHHHFRKCAHARTSEELDLQRIQSMTSANAESIGAAVRGTGSPTAGMSDAELADFYAWRASKGGAKSLNQRTAEKTPPEPVKAADTQTVAATEVEEMPVSIGDQFLFDGQLVTILSKQFGRIKAETEDGTEIAVTKDKLIPVTGEPDEQT